MRNLNLKFVSSVVFAITFLIGGFFINMETVFAEDSTTPTLSSYTVSEIIISPNNDGVKDSSSIDIAYSEQVNADINILNSSGVKVRDIYNSSSVTNPTAKVWDGKNNSDTVVPDGVYTIQILGTNLAGNTVSDTSKTITVDVTIPVIALIGANPVNVTVGDSYTDAGATASDNVDGDITTSIVTVNPVDVNSIGTYTITYNISDSVGNIATQITRTVNVTSASDPVATAFNNISTTLTSAGIANNLNTVTNSNYTNFSGLYFEKSIDSVKMGKITFTSALDLSKDETKTFLQNLGTKMDMAQAGIIGLDFSDNTPDILTDDPSLKGVSATIEFYGLDKLGFDASSTSDEINAKLIAYDDDENILNMSNLVDTPGIYTPPVGICEVGGACYIFSVDVNHFTKYKIDDATETTPNIDGNVSLSGETKGVVITNPDQAVTVTIENGTENPIIDVSSFISLVEGEKTGTLPEINITSDVADVAIPDNTLVTGPTDWDGVIDAPTSGTPAGGNAPAGFSVGNTVISIGSDSGTLVFDKPVTILLAGVTGTVGYRPALSNTWQTITNVCGGSYNAPDSPIAPGECAINNGTDTKIVTYHFTSFGGLDPVSSRSSSGSYPRPVVKALVVNTAPVVGKVLGVEKFHFTRFIKFKMGSYKVKLQGNEVIELQKFLNTTLGNTLVIDGKFGPKTKGAVIKFQIANGLKGDGVVGPLTRAILNKSR